MLRIGIPAGNEGISQNTFDEQQIPLPVNGTDTDEAGNLIMLFDDEQQAVTYLDGLEDFASSVDDNSPAKNIISLIVSAISNDEFVQTYLQ